MTTTHPILKKAYYAVFLMYVAILPVSGTIALRNLLMVALLLLLLVGIVTARDALAFQPRAIWNRVPLPFKLWALFLLLFPLWAVQHDVALQNLGSQWLPLLLSAMVAWGAVMLLGAAGPSLLVLGLASAIPIGAHLLLFLAGLCGWLSPDFYANPTIGNVGKSFAGLFGAHAYTTLHFSDLFAGFRGIEPMHGNLNYPADQAIALFLAGAGFSWDGAQARSNWKFYAGICLCLLSVFIAQSRGGILFSALLLSLAFVTWYGRVRVRTTVLSHRAPSAHPLRVWLAVAVAAVLLLVVAVQSVRHDQRWKSMADKVSLGMQTDDPIRLMCDGPTPDYIQRIRAQFPNDPAYAQNVIEGLESQDGGRILLMRIGSQMALDNWRGLDGSRQSYKKLIAEKCGHVPVLDFAHTHQGWLDLTLALGWAGLLLFACVMGFFVRAGWQAMLKSGASQWAFALFLVTAFWICRGFADSIYREHNLEMQFVVISYLYARLVTLR